MNKEAIGIVGAITLIILIILLIIAGPFLTIWALNTLFPVLVIAYTWKTWCAVLLLGLALNPYRQHKKSDAKK